MIFSQEKEKAQESWMTSVMYGQEAKSHKDREATWDVPNWRSLAISARSVLMAGRAELRKGAVAAIRGS